MKRKCCGTVLLLSVLTCVMGADGIIWGPGEPVPNPGGQGSTLEGSGTYLVDPANTFSSVYFNQQVGKLVISNQANAQNNKWDKTVTITPGTYDTWGELTTITPPNKINVTKTNIVNVTVK